MHEGARGHAINVRLRRDPRKILALPFRRACIGITSNRTSRLRLGCPFAKGNRAAKIRLYDASVDTTAARAAMNNERNKERSDKMHRNNKPEI